MSNLNDKIKKYDEKKCSKLVYLEFLYVKHTKQHIQNADKRVQKNLKLCDVCAGTHGQWLDGEKIKEQIDKIFLKEFGKELLE